MALAQGIAALTSLKSLYEMARDLRDSNDPEKIRITAAQMFELALSAREQTAALQEERNAAVVELATLKAEMEKNNRFDELAANMVREKDRNTGAFIYREKNAADAEGGSPRFCPNCFSDRKLKILQPGRGVNPHLAFVEYACPECELRTPLTSRG